MEGTQIEMELDHLQSSWALHLPLTLGLQTVIQAPAAVGLSALDPMRPHLNLYSCEAGLSMTIHLARKILLPQGPGSSCCVKCCFSVPAEIGYTCSPSFG